MRPRPRKAARTSGRVAFQGHIHLCSTVSASIHAVLHGRLVWRPRARVTQRRAMRRARPAHLHDVSINMANLGQGWHRPRAVGTAREADLLVRSRSLRWSRARVRLPDPHPDATPSSTLLSCPAHSQGHSKHITRPTGGRASLSLSLPDSALLFSSGRARAARVPTGTWGALRTTHDDAAAVMLSAASRKHRNRPQMCLPARHQYCQITSIDC